MSFDDGGLHKRRLSEGTRGNQCGTDLDVSLGRTHLVNRCLPLAFDALGTYLARKYVCVSLQNSTFVSIPIRVLILGRLATTSAFEYSNTIALSSRYKTDYRSCFPANKATSKVVH